jgi:hypothetical protein
MRSEGIDCTRIRDLIAVRLAILRDFVHVFPSFTDDFLLFPSDDAGRFALTVTTVVFINVENAGGPVTMCQRWCGLAEAGSQKLWGRKRKSKKKKEKNVDRIDSTTTGVRSQPKRKTRKVGGQLALSVYNTVYRRNNIIL